MTIILVRLLRRLNYRTKTGMSTDNSKLWRKRRRHRASRAKYAGVPQTERRLKQQRKPRLLPKWFANLHKFTVLAKIGFSTGVTHLDRIILEYLSFTILSRVLLLGKFAYGVSFYNPRYHPDGDDILMYSADRECEVDTVKFLLRTLPPNYMYKMAVKQSHVSYYIEQVVKALVRLEDLEVVELLFEHLLRDIPHIKRVHPEETESYDYNCQTKKRAPVMSGFISVIYYAALEVDNFDIFSWYVSKKKVTDLNRLLHDVVRKNAVKIFGRLIGPLSDNTEHKHQSVTDKPFSTASGMHSVMPIDQRDNFHKIIHDAHAYNPTVNEYIEHMLRYRNHVLCRIERKTTDSHYTVQCIYREWINRQLDDGNLLLIYDDVKIVKDDVNRILCEPLTIRIICYDVEEQFDSLGLGFDQTLFNTMLDNTGVILRFADNARIYYPHMQISTKHFSILRGLLYRWGLGWKQKERAGIAVSRNFAEYDKQYPNDYKMSQQEQFEEFFQRIAGQFGTQGRYGYRAMHDDV